MNFLCRFIRAFILTAFCLLLVSTTAPAQESSGKEQSQADAASLQKAAEEAQARIRENEADRDQLLRAIKLNQVDSAKEVLLRTGFTAQDLENAKIILLTGGGKGGEDPLTISTKCCDPKEITIQRTSEYFTK